MKNIPKHNVVHNKHFHFICNLKIKKKKRRKNMLNFCCGFIRNVYCPSGISVLQNRKQGAPSSLLSLYFTFSLLYSSRNNKCDMITKFLRLHLYFLHKQLNIFEQRHLKLQIYHVNLLL